MPYRFRWALLLIASYTFYMVAIPTYGLLLLGSTVVDYFLGIAIASSSRQSRRRLMLALSLSANLGVLFLFKYFNLFADSVGGLAEFMGGSLSLPVSQLILPIGISFYTFQTLSYSIDVFRGDLQPERHFGRYALYVSFFPQLVAGPIERATHFLPQLTRENSFDYDRVCSGLRLMGWGLFKQIVIADHLAVFVQAVYQQPESLTGPHYVLATVFFAFQIYCDFSGYSDVAIGTARVLGYDLMTNFDRPYAARSLAEFWKRWHISLSTWFRDYVYVPLGGNRVGQRRWLTNLMIVFLVSGLWHGASWTFVIWGALHGSFLVLSILLSPLRTRLSTATHLDRWPFVLNVVRTVWVFALVSFAWIFFRAESLDNATAIVARLGTSWHLLFEPDWLRQAPFELGLSKGYFVTAFGLILLMEWVQSVSTTEQSERVYHFWSQSPSLRWTSYVALLLAVLNLGASKAQPFIYFQF